MEIKIPMLNIPSLTDYHSYHAVVFERIKRIDILYV